MKIAQAVCFLCLVISCTYSPTEKYFNPQVKQTLPKGSVSLNNFDTKDTVYLYQATNFQFDVSVTNATIKEVDVVFAGAQILSTTSTRGTFSIDGNKLKTGTYQLKVQFVSNSGTGSLADVMGAEVVEIWRSWTVIIDVDPPAKPILQKSIENGFLKLSWAPSLKRNFTSYVIEKSNYYEARRITITNSLQSYFIDSSYVGSNGYSTSYFVTVNTTINTVTSDAKIVNDPQALSVNYRTTDSTATLTWRKSLYPNAFKNAVVMENSTLRNTVTTPSDTTLTLKLREVLFGQPSTISLTINPKYPPLNYYPFTGTVQIDNPTGAKQLVAPQDYYYNQVMGAVMGFSSFNSSFRIYNSSMEVVDNFTLSGIYGFSMPYPGHYLYYPSAGGVTQFDLTSRVTHSVHTRGTYSSSNITPSFVSGSDNQLASYGVFDTSELPDLAYRTGLADMNSSTILSYTDGVVPYNPNQIYNIVNRILSDDGRYAMYGTGVYQINAGTLNQVGNLSSTAYQFRPDNCDELIYLGTPTSILKTIDQSVLRTLSPPVSGYSKKNYDPVTKNILYEKKFSNKLYLINIDTQQVTIINAWSVGWIFLNGYLINSTGYYQKIM